VSTSRCSATLSASTSGHAARGLWIYSASEDFELLADGGGLSIIGASEKSRCRSISTISRRRA